jgi:hypothetical protein
MRTVAGAAGGVLHTRCWLQDARLELWGWQRSGWCLHDCHGPCGVQGVLLPACLIWIRPLSTTLPCLSWLRSCGLSAAAVCFALPCKRHAKHPPPPVLLWVLCRRVSRCDMPCVCCVALLSWEVCRTPSSSTLAHPCGGLIASGGLAGWRMLGLVVWGVLSVLQAFFEAFLWTCDAAVMCVCVLWPCVQGRLPCWARPPFLTPT